MWITIMLMRQKIRDSFSDDLHKSIIQTMFFDDALGRFRKEGSG